MTTYKRILVSLPAGDQGDILLQRAAELARGQRTQMLVVRVLDTQGGFEADGPAAALPGDRAARRVPQIQQRLDLRLARHDLGWVEARVLWGEPKVVLADLIQTWRPDLVLARTGQLPQGIDPDVDTLTVGYSNFFRRLADTLMHPTPRHA